MALTFIYGAAGSGKSTYVQKLLIEHSEADTSRNFFLIVPDQFSMQAQTDIVAKSGNEGILNIDVLSFSRLAYRIFEETGRPKETVLDDTGKSLVLRHVTSKVADDMPYIGKNLNKTGYIHEIKSSISEFMQYGVSVGDLEAIKDKGRGSGQFRSGRVFVHAVFVDRYHPCRGGEEQAGLHTPLRQYRIGPQHR